MKRLLVEAWKHLIPESLKPHISRRLAHRFNVGVVGCFFDEEGRVLLFRHTYRRHPWGVPSGWLEKSEQPEDGLLRELREESGLDADIIGLHEVRVDRSRMDVIMVGRYRGGSFTPSEEVDDWALCPPAGLPEGIDPSQTLMVIQAWDVWGPRIKRR